MKRVAFLGRACHTLPTHRALLNSMARHVEVVVYCEVPIEREWLDLEHDYKLRAVVNRKLPRRLRDIVFFFLLVKDHLAARFHVVHAHSTYPSGILAVFFQTIFHVPAIVSLDAAEGSALPDIEFGDLLSAKRTRLNRWVINRACVVTCLTEFQRKEVVRNLRIARDILVIPRGVDVDKFVQTERKKNNPAVSMLSVGYLNLIKDPETLLRAFQYIQEHVDCELVIVGKDYMNGASQKLAVELGISAKVRFEGYIDYDVMPVYYRRAHILIHASRYESQGMAVAEAMLSGVLVVGTNVGLISDLSPACCLAVDPCNPRALAEAVVRLLSDKAKMDIMRESALQWSRINGLDVTVEKLLTIYHRLANKK